MLAGIIGWAASTGLGQGAVKAQIKAQFEKDFQKRTEYLEKIKGIFEKSGELGEELSALFKKIEDERAEFLSFGTADAQLTVFARIFANKISQFEASFDKFKEFCEESPAFTEMQAFAAQLVSPEIYQGLANLIKQSGKIKNLELAEQMELVELLKSNQIAQKLRKINLQKAVDGFKESADKFGEELELNKEDTEALNAMFKTVKQKHFAKFQEIKKDLESQLPTIMRNLLDYVYKKCPHLAIEEAPKAITPAKTAASKYIAKAGPRKNIAANDAKVAEPVKKKGPPKKAAVVDVDEEPVKKKAPKRKVTETPDPIVIQNKKGPRRK